MIDSYRLRMAAMGGYEGEARRRNSQKIMESSWMRDVATKPVFVKWVDSGLPVVDDDDEVLYAKYNIKSYHNITGDEIAYLLQFRLEDLKNRPDIKVGSYVQIRNEMDEPEWWLIVHFDDRLQFREFSILKCLHTFRWVSRVDGKRRIYECLGAPRNQSSYNSGVWLDYTFQVPENQQIVIFPTNDDSRTIQYDTKFILGDEKRRPPIVWKTSKIQSSFNGDITRFTMTQEQFNPATDNAELMIADYWAQSVEPEIFEIEETPTVSDLEITYSGKPAVRAGGGFKKFALKSRIDGKLVDCPEEVNWSTSFIIEDPESYERIDASENYLDYDKENKTNIFKVKCAADYSLIGKTFTITATTKYSLKSLIVEVTSL